MKYRDYKIFRPNHYYHIYNRGNNKEPIFKEPADYLYFLQRLRIILNLEKNKHSRIKPLPIGAFTIACYCLMDNHFHLLIQQNSDIGIEKIISKVCTSYTSYFNKKYKHTGHVFQDTFKAKLVENDSYMTYLSAYIHNNPNQPFDYEYSSLDTILGKAHDRLCNKNTILSFFEHSPKLYKSFVANYTKTSEEQIEHLIFEE